jgi:hypothetical protein
MPQTTTRNLIVTRRLKLILFHLGIFILVSNLPALAKKGKKTLKSDSGQASVVLWSPPADIGHRNLFFGPGGQQDQPHTTFTFIKEDLDGSSPKFSVRDQDGTKWKVKLGAEARPETAATRLVWAVGYRVDEDYFVPLLQVKGMPAHLRRGQEWVVPGGKVRDARLERYLKGEKKVGRWDWQSNPFTGTRELDGLRIMMALVNNWDLKSDNNTIYQDSKSGTSSSRRLLIYSVSDLGASFGSGGRGWTMAKSKGDLKAYSHTKFIREAATDYISFNDPRKPPFLFFLNLPEFILRIQMHWVCSHIPRAHAQWIAQLLAQLSPEQIRDAFRAAGYSPNEIEGYTKAVEGRIAELNDL